MLSEEEKQEVQHELKLYPSPKNACIDALKIVQHHRGWISDDSVKDIADYLTMSPEEVDSVATFYNLIFRKPVGKYVILFCDSISCWVMGYENLLDHLKSRLGIDVGETTEDGLFTLLPVPCLGTCEQAPAMMVGEDLHVHLTTEKIDEIIESYRNR
jgi:NADH-quinone oxidoreductase subunit E